MPTPYNISRKLARHAIGTGLRAVLVGTGLPCKVVYDEPTIAWHQESPATLIATGGSLRGRGSGQLKSRSDEFQFAIVTIVPESDPTATPPYTSANSEDALDDIEAIISDWILRNESSPGIWSDLIRVPSLSLVEKIIDLKPYKMETILVQCKPVYLA